MNTPREWQAPSSDATETYKLGWLNEAAEQGAAFNEAQRGYRDWRVAFDILSGSESQKGLLSYRSNLSGRRLKTNIRTAISGLANIRPLWGFHASEAFADYATALNRTCWALYLEGDWDQDVKEALWWAAATGSGWIRPVYRRNLQGEGNIHLDVFGMPCVLPVQLPRNGDYQGAYAVTLLEEIPIYEAHWRFPDFQDRLKPTTSRYWYAPEIRKASENNGLKRMMNWFKRTKEDKLTDQYIPIRWATINDLSINTSGRRIAMGEPGSSWYYEVPFMGEELKTGRKADENDCKLYPQRRTMISSENCVMYDGPAFNWDGKLDLAQFTVDKMPWEPNGFSMVHDGAPIQKAIDAIDRGALDKLAAQQDPPLGYPINGVTKLEADSFDPLEPRARIGFDEQAVERPFVPAVDPSVYQIGAEALKVRELLVEELDYQLGTRDVIEMAKARSLGQNMDSLEALVASYGPIVKDIARSMEKSLGRVGSMVGWRILQYMGTSRLMQYAGAETLSMGVWDYDPASIVPSHLPGEMAHGPDAEGNATVPRQSDYTKMERAKWFGKNVRFFLMPHSVHETTQMTFRLGMMQLKSRGLPISDYTVLTGWEVPNVKKPEGNSEQEMYWAEQREKLVQAAQIQKVVETLGVEFELGAAGGAPSQASNGSKGGRPSTDAVAPHLETKGDGRPVVSTSQ